MGVPSSMTDSTTALIGVGLELVVTGLRTSGVADFLLHCVVLCGDGLGIAKITVCNVCDLSTLCTLHNSVGLTRCNAQLTRTLDSPLIHIMWISFCVPLTNGG